MFKKRINDNRSVYYVNHIKDFQVLLRYINSLAQHKLGYPVSLLTYLGVIDNQALGIMPGSLANVLLNNVGDPFKDSETSRMEVKRHERMVLKILAKYYGLDRNAVKGYVTTGGTEGNFASLWWSKRFLINSLLDRLIKMDDVIKLQVREEQQLLQGLNKIATNDYANRAQQFEKIFDLKNAITANKAIVQEILTPTVFYTKNHTHYSIPKISEILHLNIRPVAANADGSMDLANFKREVLLNMNAHPNSSIVVIANIGTTVTGAIDDVPGIKKILEELKPTCYTIHMDGALTGFVLPILKPFGDVPNYFTALGVNTLAVSAHKYPGLSQPCGIILAEKKFFDKAFEKSERSIDYVGNILDVTITGSRSGLNVLMFYNALRALGLHKNNEILQKMVEENLESAKYLYNKLVKLYGAERVSYLYHFNVSFPRPSLAIAKKYQLMLTGDMATICVLTNVTRELIDKFVHELQINKELVMDTVLAKCKMMTLTDKHAKAAVDLFTECFCHSEPLTKHLHIGRDDFLPFAEDVIKKAIQDKMSKILVDEENEVIACTIAEDVANPFRPNLSHYPKHKAIFSLIDELAKPFVHGKKFLPGKIAHVWVSAVAPHYRGKRMSIKLDDDCFAALRDQGYEFVYSEFTNPLSEKVVHQFKVVKLLNKINFTDFQMADGQKPFAGLAGATACYVASLKPEVTIESLKHCYTVTSSVST